VESPGSGMPVNPDEKKRWKDNQYKQALASIQERKE
jgi:hypothetical protein